MDATHREPLKLFVSYARADQAWAQRLIHALDAAAPGQYDIWWDARLQGGESFQPAIEAALVAADVVVVLWSRTSVESHWVRDEATIGVDRRRLVPISIDGTVPPLGFRQFQVIDMAGWTGQADDVAHKVVSAIHGAAGTPMPALPPGPVRAARGLDRRMLLIGGGGAALAGMGGLLAWQWRRAGGAPSAAANSVAVLPFRNLSGDAAQDYLVDGFAEELRTTLSLNRQLLVSGAGSAGTFRTTEAEPRQIAAKLGVSNLLSGSMRISMGQVRVAVRLVDGASGFDRWSRAFDRALTDVLAVQAEIAAIVADALISTLAKDPAWRAERPGGTRNAAAFDAYAMGQALYRASGSREEDLQALAAIDKAIALDAGFAAAHAARARTLTAIANQDSDPAVGKQRRKAAQASARDAIALAPDMAEGHAALGFLLMSELNLAGALPPYRKSKELGPGNAPILSAYAEFSANIGAFDEADAAIRRAMQIDPLNATVFRNAGMVALAARRYSEAREHLETALSLSPTLAIVHRCLGDIALVTGDVAEARRQFAAEPSALSRLRGLAIADARLSGQAAGDAQMAQLVAAFGDGGLYQQGQVLAQWGRSDEALTTLEKALALGDSGLILAGYDPLLDPLRDEPRFAAILARIGLGQPA